MNNKKRKGFTLVELIGALAILAIGMVGISLAFNTSSTMWKKTKESMELVSDNQSIAQNLRAEGKNMVEEIYNDIKNKNNTSDSCYIYFNDYDEIKTTITSEPFTDYKVASASPSFSECESMKGDKKYGALIKVQDATPDGNYYKLYQVSITTWYFQEEENTMSKSTFYIGRWNILWKAAKKGLHLLN